MKGLAVDERRVHAQLRVQPFDERPQVAGSGELSIAPFTSDGSYPVSAGDIPLSRQSLVGWQPEFITNAPVRDEELEGYRISRDGDGRNL